MRSASASAKVQAALVGANGGQDTFLVSCGRLMYESAEAMFDEDACRVLVTVTVTSS